MHESERSAAAGRAAAAPDAPDALASVALVHRARLLGALLGGLRHQLANVQMMTAEAGIPGALEEVAERVAAAMPAVDWMCERPGAETGPVPVDGLLEDVRALARWLPPWKGVPVEVVASPGLPAARARRPELGQALLAILAHALAPPPRDREARGALRARAGAGALVLELECTVVAPDARARLARWLADPGDAGAVEDRPEASLAVAAALVRLDGGRIGAIEGGRNGVRLTLPEWRREGT